jgi:branched-chain amino acid transport system substrate-binding protein
MRKVPRHYGAKNMSTTATSRRRFLLGAGGLGVGSALGLPLPVPAIAQSASVKIGVLAPMSGVFSSLGEHKVRGIKLFFQSVDMKVAGRPVELLIEDDEGKPQEGLRKARKLVESDKVDLLLGVLSSAVGYAVKEYVTRAKRVWVTTGAAADGIFKKANLSPYAFRSSLSTWQGNNPMGAWLAKQKIERIIVTGSDYSMGREAATAFQLAFEAGGPKIQGSVYPPLGTTDFGSYLAEIKRQEPQAVYATFAGSDAVRFVQQYAEFGLAQAIPLTGYGYLVEEDVLAAVGEAGKGVRSGLNWAYGLNTDRNRDFVARFEAAYKTTPTVDAVAGYVGAQVVYSALSAMNGDIPNQEALSAAIGVVKIETPRGPISFDPATNNVVQTIFVREVADNSGIFHNRVLEAYEDVRDPGA